MVIETPAGEQSLGGPRGKKDEEGEGEEAVVVAAAGAKKLAKATTEIEMRKRNPRSGRCRRGLPARGRGSGMERQSRWRASERDRMKEESASSQGAALFSFFP